MYSGVDRLVPLTQHIDLLNVSLFRTFVSHDWIDMRLFVRWSHMTRCDSSAFADITFGQTRIGYANKDLIQFWHIITFGVCTKVPFGLGMDSRILKFCNYRSFRYFTCKSNTKCRQKCLPAANRPSRLANSGILASLTPFSSSVFLSVLLSFLKESGGTVSRT